MIIGFEAQRIFREHKHGMDFVALELIRALQKIDKQNSYVVFTNEGPDKSCLEESDNLSIVTFKASFPVWEQVLLPGYVRRHNCDLLHCTSNTAPVFSSIPTVVTLHDIIYLESNPLTGKGYTLYQRFGNYYRRLVVKAILNKVEKLVTVSEFEKKRMLDFLNLDEQRIEVVYNGVGAHFFHQVEDDQLKRIKVKYKLPEEYFLFLGNTDPKKNTKNTIIAFAKYVQEHQSNAYLVVADLDGELVRGILSSAGLENYYSRVHFTGYIDNNDLPAVIQGAKLFLYPSKRESFGIPILEAMAGGVPVVTSNAASMPEVAGGQAFLIKPLEVDSIVEGIHSLMDSSDLRVKLSQGGRSRALSFSWDQSAQEMLNIYKTLKQ